jgi:hypothetical protein
MVGFIIIETAKWIFSGRNIEQLYALPQGPARYCWWGWRLVPKILYVL